MFAAAAVGATLGRMRLGPTEAPKEAAVLEASAAAEAVRMADALERAFQDRFSNEGDARDLPDFKAVVTTWLDSEGIFANRNRREALAEVMAELYAGTATAYMGKAQSWYDEFVADKAPTQQGHVASLAELMVKIARRESL